MRNSLDGEKAVRSQSQYGLSMNVQYDNTLTYQIQNTF